MLTLPKHASHGRLTVKLRFAALATAGLALTLGLAGCNMLTPQATTTEYNPADGLNGEAGDVAFRNILLVVDAADTSRASVNVTFVNNSDSVQRATVQVGGQEITVPLQPGVTVYGYEDNQIILPVDNPVPGSSINTAVTIEGFDPVSLEVQVFSSEGSGYEELKPTPENTVGPVDPTEEDTTGDDSDQ